MARTGIVFGLLLCGLTFLALVWTPFKSPTQFIPMMLGIPILFCGVVALNPHRRKHAMHVASAIATLGALAGLTRVFYYLLRFGGGADVNPDTFRLVLAMSLLCIVFVVVCVISFIEARRRKTGRNAAATRTTLNLRQAADKDAAPAKVKSRESA